MRVKESSHSFDPCACLVTTDSFNYLTHQAAQSPTGLRVACFCLHKVHIHPYQCIYAFIYCVYEHTYSKNMIFRPGSSSICFVWICEKTRHLSLLPKIEQCDGWNARHTLLYRPHTYMHIQMNRPACTETQGRTTCDAIFRTTSSCCAC